MPVLPRRRDEIGEPVEELKRREFDDAVGPRPRGLPPAARADPVGRFVSRQHVTHAGDPAVWAADHGEPLEGEGRPGTVSEKMFQTLKIAGHVAVDESPRAYSTTGAIPWQGSSAADLSRAVASTTPRDLLTIVCSRRNKQSTSTVVVGIQ